MSFRDGSYHHVRGVARSPGSVAFDHQAGPDQGGRFIERQNAPGKCGLRTVRPVEPSFEIAPSAPSEKAQQAAPNFGQGHARDEKVVVRLGGGPPNKRRRTHWLYEIADDVRVEQVARQRPSLRSRIAGRSNSTPAKADGARRRAARTPPFLPWGPDRLRPTSMRSRAASAPSSANRLAKVRINFWSSFRPITSKRETPRLPRRLR